MVINKKINFIILIGLFLSLVNLSFGAYPQFDFSQTNYPSGEISVVGRASSGTQVLLSVNGEYISAKDVFANSKYENLTTEIKDVSIPIGAKITFVNMNPSNTYRLNFSNGEYAAIGPGQEYEFESYDEGTIYYTNLDSSVRKRINVVDQLVEFSFDDLTRKFNNGENNISFTLKSPLTTLINSQDFEYIVDYQKYSNIITVSNYNPVVNTRSVEITGSVMDTSSPLYYVVNMDSEIGNRGMLQQVELENGNFNITVTYLREGNNSIRFLTFESATSDYINGEEKINVFVDTQEPSLTLLTALKLYTNQENLLINLTSDGQTLDYTFNGKNESLDIVDGLLSFELNLKKGQNNLTLSVKDEAGNEYRESHNIQFDDSEPQLIRDSMKPEDLFKTPNEAHFLFQSISGKTNKPNVEVTAFTFPRNTQDLNGNSISCENFKNALYRNLDNVDNSGQVDGAPELDDAQISLWSLVSKKQTFRTDSEGKFGADSSSLTGALSSLSDTVVLFFHEDTMDSSDAQDANRESTSNPSVRSVRSDNVICFIMKDEFGNVASQDFTVKLDAGNTLWKLDEVTTIPNTVYAAEIEQGESERRANNGNAGFSMIIKLSYIGDGTVTAFSPKISVGAGGDSKFVKITSDKQSFTYDKTTKVATIVAQAEMKPQGIKPLDYPSELNFWFKGKMTYSLDNLEIPIDDANFVHIPVKINIEKPLDHTKWLTPGMIKKGQGFLNKSIKLTQKATDVMQKATIGGVLTCTGAKLYYTYQMGLAENAMRLAGNDVTKQKKAKDDFNEAQRQLFMICDRVVGLASPPKCEESPSSSTSGIISIDNPISDGSLKRTTIGSDKLSTTSVVTQDSDQNDVMTRFGDLTLTNKCDFDGNGKDDDGILISGEVTTFAQEGIIWQSQTTSKQYVSERCVKYTKGSDNNKINLQLNTMANSCFTPLEPKFDSTKCNFFGMDGKDGVPDMDPSDNILYSIRCGVITDTYTHLGNILKIQKDIYQCLEEAKLGVVKGTYCERLISQAVCDIATNALLYYAKNSQKHEKLQSETDTHTSGTGDSALLAGLAQAKKGDKILKDRYKGSFFTKTGLDTASLANKACVAAISGDISVLTDSVMAAVDQNEVEPIFGPPFAESRINGYDPIRGMLNIQYRFSYGVYSGGQRITSKITFICDPIQTNGEYCPEYVESSDTRVRTDLRVTTRTVPKGGSVSETVSLYDKSAQVWYNQIRIEHTYTLKGKTEIKTQEFLIGHKGELFGECSFTGGVLGSGAGIKCGTVFTDNALASSYKLDKTRTSFIPSNIFYPGQAVKVNLGYETALGGDDNQQTGFDLGYKATCRGIGGDTTRAGKITPITAPTGRGTEDVKMFNIPQIIGTSNTQSSYVYTFDNLLDKGEYCMKLITNENRQTVTITAGSPRNFKINSGNNNYIISNSNNLNIQVLSETEKISFVTSTQNEVNVVLSKGTCTSTSSSIGGFSRTQSKVVNNDFNNLQYGNCKLNLMILPLNSPGSIRTAEDFDNYNPDSANSNIITSEPQRDIIEIPFEIKELPANGETVSSFTLKEISSGQTICLSKISTILPIKYSYTIQPTGSSPDKFEGSITPLNYNINDNILNKIISPTNLNPDGVNTQIQTKFIVSDLFRTNPTSGTSTAQTIFDNIFGLDTNERLQLRLNYKVIKTNEKTKIIKQDSVDFYVTFSDNCEAVPTPSSTASGNQNNNAQQSTNDVVPTTRV